MSVTTASFYTLLSGDGTLTALLATYNSRPAIFTYEPIPKNVGGPYIITVGEISNDPALDTKDSTGRRMIRDIRCYAPGKGSSSPIEAIAARVRVLFHRASLSITGFKTIYVDVSGPIIADEENVYARVLSVGLLLSTL